MAFKEGERPWLTENLDIMIKIIRAMVNSETSTYVFVFVTLHFEGKPNHKTGQELLVVHG